MSTKSPISHSPRHYLYFDEILSDEPKYAYLELNEPGDIRFEKETYQGKMSEILTVQIPTEMMDQIAIDWIKKRNLQGKV